MKKTLVIGIGSRIMLDDAIGIHLVEDLKSIDKCSGITYIVGETDVDYCVGEILDYDFIVVIDAFLSGKQPCDISVLPLEDLSEENAELLYSMHGIHLLKLLSNSKYSTKGIFIGVEPYEINYGFTLSKQLSCRYSNILQEVQQQLSKYIEQ